MFEGSPQPCRHAATSPDLHQKANRGTRAMQPGTANRPTFRIDKNKDKKRTDKKDKLQTQKSAERSLWT